MACRYWGDFDYEKAKVVALIEYLKTEKLPDYYGNPDKATKLDGYSEIKLDDVTEELCSKCQNITMIRYIPELNGWWESHKSRDYRRLVHLFKKLGGDTKEFLRQLTPFEKELWNEKATDSEMSMINETIEVNREKNAAVAKLNEREIEILGLRKHYGA